MDLESTNNSIQTQNVEQPSEQNNSSTSENEPQNVSSQIVNVLSEDEVANDNLSGENNEHGAQLDTNQEIPAISSNDIQVEKTIENELKESRPSEMKLHVESGINEDTIQTQSNEEHNSVSSAFLREQVGSKKDEDISGDTGQCDVAVESNKSEVRASVKSIVRDNEHDKAEKRLSTSPVSESSALLVVETKDILVSRSNSMSPSKSGGELPATSDRMSRTPRSYSREDEEHKKGGNSIKNMFTYVSLAQVTSSDLGSDSEAGDGVAREDNRSIGSPQIGGKQTKGDVVLVTGGCGFLGQHIVKLLQLRASHVTEIRVLDLDCFEKRLDYQPMKRVTSLVGDVSNRDFVDYALRGVNTVFHVAGVVSYGTFPDYARMEKVNVKGTLNVVKSCLKNNVDRLVYCSTVDVAIGNKPIRDGTEENTPVPDKFLFPGYPESKYHGERIVQGIGQYKRDDGSGHLQTVILRPNVLYGELDKYYVTNALRQAYQSMGILYKIGNGGAMFQQAYVGNAAWAFICADTAMKANPKLTNEIFYIPDNTPVQNTFSFLAPYLEAHKLKFSNGFLSYALSHSAVAAAEMFAKIISPIVKVHLPVQSCTIAYINTDLYFQGRKAGEMLNYQPIYTPNEAREMSMKYYANISLEDRPQRRKTTDVTSEDNL